MDSIFGLFAGRDGGELVLRLGARVPWQAVGGAGVDGDDGGRTSTSNITDQLIALRNWNVLLQCWIQRVLQRIAPVDRRGH